MTDRKSSTLRFVAAALILIACATSGSAIARALTTATAPTVTALLYPADGSVLSKASRPDFTFQATPGGRFRVQFSTGKAPFVPLLDSGRRTTSGDTYKPSVSEWRSIAALGAGGRVVYWRVIALSMTADQVAAAPVSSFTVVP